MEEAASPRPPARFRASAVFAGQLVQDRRPTGSVSCSWLTPSPERCPGPTTTLHSTVPIARLPGAEGSRLPSGRGDVRFCHWSSQRPRPFHGVVPYVEAVPRHGHVPHLRLTIPSFRLTSASLPVAIAAGLVGADPAATTRCAYRRQGVHAFSDAAASRSRCRPIASTIRRCWGRTPPDAGPPPRPPRRPTRRDRSSWHQRDHVQGIGSHRIPLYAGLAKPGARPLPWSRDPAAALPSSSSSAFSASTSVGLRRSSQASRSGFTPVSALAADATPTAGPRSLRRHRGIPSRWPGRLVGADRLRDEPWPVEVGRLGPFCHAAVQRLVGLGWNCVRQPESPYSLTWYDAVIATSGAGGEEVGVGGCAPRRGRWAASLPTTAVCSRSCPRASTDGETAVGQHRTLVQQTPRTWSCIGGSALYGQVGVVTWGWVTAGAGAGLRGKARA